MGVVMSNRTRGEIHFILKKKKSFKRMYPMETFSFGTMSSVIMLILVISSNTNGQRTQYDIEREETLRNRHQSQNVDRTDIGQFPYNRGETPIFNFDIGDEPFLQTIPDLVTGLRDMANVVSEQTKVTGAY